MLKFDLNLQKKNLNVHIYIIKEKFCILHQETATIIYFWRKKNQKIKKIHTTQICIRGM